MSADERLLEILAELLPEVQGLRGDVNGLQEDVRNVKSEVAEFRQDTNIRFGETNEELNKLRLSFSELRQFNMALAREIDRVLDLDRRLKIVEEIVLSKAS